MIDIFLVRHGQSEANVNNSLYFSKHDSEMILTDKGIEQAKEAGRIINKLAQDGRTLFRPFTFDVYHSPYVRAKQTQLALTSVLDDEGNLISEIREDPRIREREWGQLRDIAHSKQDTKDHYGFFYKPADGESFANLYDRAACFDQWLNMKYHFHGGEHSERQRIIIVAHGEFNKVYAMYKLGLTIDEWNKLSNPWNGEVYHFFRVNPYANWQLNPETPFRKSKYI